MHFYNIQATNEILLKCWMLEVSQLFFWPVESNAHSFNSGIQFWNELQNSKILGKFFDMKKLYSQGPALCLLLLFTTHNIFHCYKIRQKIFADSLRGTIKLYL